MRSVRSVRGGVIGSTIAAAVLLLGLQAAPSFAATPATSTPEPVSSSALPVAAAAQTSHEARVASFLAAHPKPAPLTSSASTEQLAQNHAQWYAFLQQVPWTDMFGQWGCTVSDVHVAMTVDGNGNSNPTVTDISNCGGVEAVGPMALSLQARSTVLAEPSNAPLRALFQAPAATPAATGATTNGTVAPLADTARCGHSNSTYDCIVFNYSNGLIGATTEWEGSSSTYGHVRLGNVGAGSCGLGTFMLNVPDGTINPGSQSQALETGQYYNSYFSARFYNPNYAGGHCADN